MKHMIMIQYSLICVQVVQRALKPEAHAEESLPTDADCSFSPTISTDEGRMTSPGGSQCRAEAMKHDTSNIKVTMWEDGKAVGK